MKNMQIDCYVEISVCIVSSIYPKAGNLDHRWVARSWLNDLGLGQYSLQFESERIDGRVLNSLTKKDLEKHLGITRKFHHVSLLHGIELLRRIHFDKGVSFQMIQIILLKTTSSPYPTSLTISIVDPCRGTGFPHHDWPLEM